MYLTAWLPTRITNGRWEYQDGYSYYNDSKNNVLIYKTVGQFGFMRGDYTKITFSLADSNQNIFSYLNSGDVNVTDSSSTCVAFAYLR